MSAAIAIFVKTPGLSPIKTRLAASVGQAAAERWYRQAAQTTLAVVSRYVEVSSAVAYWAVAEAQAMDAKQWACLPRIEQCRGGLGERMAAVYDTLLQRHGAALLIGADSPQLEASELIRAAHWLQGGDSPEASRFALGPAVDGGFWLFAGNRPLPLSAWTDVGYSQRDTAAQFRRSIGQRGHWLELARLRDVDTGADLPGVADALDALPAALAEQRALATLSRALLTEQGLGV